MGQIWPSHVWIFIAQNMGAITKAKPHSKWKVIIEHTRGRSHFNVRFVRKCSILKPIVKIIFECIFGVTQVRKTNTLSSQGGIKWNLKERKKIITAPILGVIINTKIRARWGIIIERTLERNHSNANSVIERLQRSQLVENIFEPFMMLK